MMRKDPDVAELPIGFHRFHKRRFINYQLNRAHALGFVDYAQLKRAATGIRTREDCVREFDALSRQAEQSGATREATTYLRLAEFFTPPGDDKLERYCRYRSLFDAGFPGGGLMRHEVPYEGSALPAYLLPAAGGTCRGTVVVHGGFDSLIEEFYAIWERISAAGFDVIAFDGPGQGGARALGHLTFDHDWEKPVSAVLDYFDVLRASLVGISMGGYWALRAAGREPRIKHVVAWPPVYDWMLRAPAAVRAPARAMLRRRGFMRWSVATRARLVPTLRLVVDQVLYASGSDDVFDVVQWFLAMNPEHLGSERITQDVLVMVGENDSFQPPKLAQAQVRALTAARTVTARLFTGREHADQHCQMGNLDLACGVVTGWLADCWRSTPPV